MVGPLNSPEVPGALADAPLAVETEKRGISALLSTTTGKLIVGGIAVALVLGALGIIAVVFVFSGPSAGDVVVVPQASSGDTSSTLEPEPVRRQDPSPDDVFSFRNIFAPTAKPTVTVTGESSTASGTADGVQVPQDTLFLQAVSVEDGDEVATFIWNGSSYTAAEGARLGSTPWKVLSIAGNAVEMLYGDSRVTLIVGQGLGK